MSNQQGMSKRQMRREQRRRSEQRGRMVWIVIIVVVAILAAFVLIWPNIRPAGEVKAANPIPRSQVQANTAGDPNAPIKLDEYADFQCPICQRFTEEVEPQLVEAYVNTGKVFLTFHSMGLFIGEESVASAEAAYCAGDQGKFWDMHDTIFANWDGENVGNYSNPRLTAFAEKVGLDMGEYRSCFNGGKYSSQVQQDQVDGTSAGVNATPSFVLSYTVNGQEKSELIRGLITFDQFKEKFDAALADMGVQ